MTMKQIIAIGGGGFGRSIGELKIEKYIFEQASMAKPNICFIPTATGDDQNYIENFYKAFDSLGAETSHINFFKRTIDLEKHIAGQDIIFVGGGNTKSMLSVWKEWNLDKILLDAYKEGTIMSGVSAGAICWFDKGITDSWAHGQSIIECLGLVDGVCCPHYDEEPERIPFVKKSLSSHEIESCIALEGYSALHIIDDIPTKIISFKNNKKCYDVRRHEDNICTTTINDAELVVL